MVIDVAEIKKAVKPKADSTLHNMKKTDLIEYIRCLENNYNVAVWFNENQARYIKNLDAVPVVRCRNCKNWGGVVFGNVCRRWSAPLEGMRNNTKPDDFCSYGERKDGVDK